MPDMRSAEELSDLFRANGKRVTPQRERIFRVLEGNTSHPSAEVVYESVRGDLGTISLKTVYETLHDLAQLGEIVEMDLGTGMALFDPNVERRHHHLVCRSCGKVQDIECDLGPLSLPEEVAASNGFVVGEPEVVFRGLCADCISTSTPS